MSGLRFGMVTTFYPPFSFGGDGIAVQRLAQALVRCGHEVTVLQPVDAYTVLHQGPEPEIAETSDGVEVVRVRSALQRLSVFLMQQTGRPVLAGRTIARMLDRRTFDVINFHNISLAGGPGILAHGRAIKLYMAHEHWLVCPMHVLWRHKRERCASRQCVRCSLRNRRPPQLWRYTDLLERQLHHVDAVIALSDFSRDKHREFGLPRPMEVINCFLPDTSAKISACESPHARPYFLFVGRLDVIKGLDDVIPVFRRYCGADLLVVGDGEHGSTLRLLAAGCDRVHFLGRLPFAELDRYYRHALALVAPSVCFETFGIVLIESFRQGTPVLARRVGPLTEIVERSGAGLLFGGPDELEGAMHMLQEDAALRGRMAAAALASFDHYWSERVVVRQYLDVVARIARETSNRAVLGALGDAAALQAVPDHSRPPHAG